MKYVLLGFALFMGGIVSGQSIPSSAPPSQHGITLMMGYNHGYLNDQNLSPLHYGERGLRYTLGYRNRRKKSLVLAELSYGSGTHPSAVSDVFTTDYIVGYLQLAYLPMWNLSRLKKLDLFKNLRLYIGPQYQFYLHYIDWEDQTAFSFIGVHSLDLSAAIRYQFGERHLASVRLSRPIVNLLVRPPYNGFDEELTTYNDQGQVLKLITDGPIGFFNQLLASDLSLNYEYLLRPNLHLRATYTQRYQESQQPFLIKHLQNTLSLGLTLTF